MNDNFPMTTNVFAIISGVEVKNKLNFQTELKFVQKGALINYLHYLNCCSFYSGKKIQFKMNYLTLPLLINLKFGNKIKYFIKSGPYISILTSAKIKGFGTYGYESSPLGDFNYVTKEIEEDFTKYLNKIVYGFHVGSGFEFPLIKSLTLHTEIETDLDFISNGLINSVSPKKNNELYNIILYLSFGFRYYL
jgi:hypothetical protein